MNIEIKKSIKPIKYTDAIEFLEERLKNINDNKKNDLIWILEHEEIYTAGTSYKEEEVLNKDIDKLVEMILNDICLPTNPRPICKSRLKTFIADAINKTW